MTASGSTSAPPSRSTSTRLGTFIPRVVIPICALTLLTACANAGSADRGAASMGPASPPSSPSQPASGNPDGEKVGFGRLGVRVCVWNNSARDIRLDWLLVDTSEGNGRLGPRTQRCGEGTFALKPMDLQVEIKFDDNLSTVFNFNNPSFGAPTVLQDPNSRSSVDSCGIGDIDVGDWGVGINQDCFDSYDDGAVQTYVDRDGYHGMTISRLKDGQWKEFLVEVKQ